MQDFESLKNMWQQPASPDDSKGEMITILKNATSAKIKLIKTQLNGATMLVLTAVFIACLAIFGNLNFVHWYTYAGMVLICLICIVQAWLMYVTSKKIKAIEDTAEPAEHLRQWEQYYELRKKQNKWNMPVYYLLLNVAMAVYMIEIFTGRPVTKVIIFIAVYAAWMLFAYFYLGRKNIQREDNRLQAIINDLRGIEGQLKRPG